MNKFKSSFKASSSNSSTAISGPAASPTRKTPSDSDLMASYEEDPKKKPAELDLQLVSDDARSQFADILGRIEGKKDIVIQPELLSLLDHVTPIGFLKK